MIKLQLPVAKLAADNWDTNSLLQHVEAEIRSFEHHSKSEIEKRETLPPEDAQGEVEIIEFIINITQDKGVIIGYLRAFMKSMNEISKRHKDNRKGDSSKYNQGIHLEIFGKNLIFPASASVIKTFIIEVFGDE